jgi:hypothetical protein
MYRSPNSSIYRSPNSSMYSIGATTVQVLILELEEKDIRPDLVQIRN